MWNGSMSKLQVGWGAGRSNFIPQVCFWTPPHWCHAASTGLCWVKPLSVSWLSNIDKRKMDLVKIQRRKIIWWKIRYTSIINMKKWCSEIEKEYLYWIKEMDCPKLIIQRSSCVSKILIYGKCSLYRSLKWQKLVMKHGTIFRKVYEDYIKIKWLFLDNGTLSVFISLRFFSLFIIKWKWNPIYLKHWNLSYILMHG